MESKLLVDIAFKSWAGFLLVSNLPVSVSISATPKRRHFNQLDRPTSDRLSDMSEHPEAEYAAAVWAVSLTVFLQTFSWFHSFVSFYY